MRQQDDDDSINSIDDDDESSYYKVLNPDITTSDRLNNLHDTFLKRHLFEASPVEPMPPIERDLENLLDMTLTKNKNKASGNGDILSS